MSWKTWVDMVLKCYLDWKFIKLELNSAIIVDVQEHWVDFITLLWNLSSKGWLVSNSVGMLSWISSPDGNLFFGGKFKLYRATSWAVLGWLQVWNDMWCKGLEKWTRWNHICLQSHLETLRYMRLNCYLDVKFIL